MSSIYNVYCDESCHLERDRQPVMVLGAVWCPLENSREISVRIREIKTRHGLSPEFESKWTKVSPANAYYVSWEHTRKKLLKDYEEYQKQQTPPH